MLWLAGTFYTLELRPTDEGVGGMTPAQETTMATISSGRALAYGLPVSTIAVLFAVTLYGGELAAQPASTVSGTVTTADNTAIPQARVRLVGTTRAAVTHADGTF